jgi:hypothetical protein
MGLVKKKYLICINIKILRMSSVNGITINATTIANCYKMYYPESYNRLVQKNRFHYLELWGIRMSTCDTSLPDDYLGGLRVNNLNFLELLSAAASTDPSPKYVQNPLDSLAAAAGGTAYVKEGQHTYNYIGKNHKNFKPYPAFCPTKPMPVYRWNPSPQEIKTAKEKKLPLSSFFDAALKAGRVKLSTSPDTCIHRTWSSTKLNADSAGCQVFANLKTLDTLGVWANDHIKKGYGNFFVYTLFTRQQFLDANSTNSIKNTINKLFFTK